MHKNLENFELYKSLHPALQRNVINELADDEVVTWLAQPIKAFYAKQGCHAGGILLTVFGVVFTWVGYDESGFFMSVGIFFVFIGVMLFSYPILWLYTSAAKIVYVLTNKRIFKLVGHEQYQIESRFPQDLRKIERRMRTLNSGDLVFDKKYSEDVLIEFAFVGVENVKDVHGLIDDLAAGYARKGG